MALFGRKKRTQQEYQKQQQSRKKGGLGRNAKVAIAALAIIIIFAAYVTYYLSVSQVVVNSPTVVNVTSAGGLYLINSNQFYISLASIAVSQGRAYVLITKYPTFINPLLNVTLTLGNITKVNAGSNYSNMGLYLESLNANSITVKISPLSPSLQISPSSQYIRTIQTSLGAKSSRQSQSSSVSTTIVSTTVGSSTSTAATTTIAQNTTQMEIMAALKMDNYYALIQNYSVLYANTSKCTPLLYNTTYVELFGHLPNGQNSFANVSAISPYNLSSSTMNAGKGNYYVNYTAKTETFGNLPAVSILVNASTSTALQNNIVSGGIFSGLSLAQLRANYITASTGGACEIWEP